MTEKSPFQEFLENEHPQWRSRYLKPGKSPLVEALNEARKRGCKEGPIHRAEFSGEEEYQRRLRAILREKAERDIFPLFKKDPNRAFEVLDRRISKEKDKNLRDVYGSLRQTYQQYQRLRIIGVNTQFHDPETGDEGTLPSLHQRIALYRIIQEKKFGIFDGCGTGKTAIATLAQPLIAQQMQREGKSLKRTVVVCPNNAKKAWKKALVGGEHERYLADAQDIAVINGETKSSQFMRNLRKKSWIVVNYEQLITKAHGITRETRDHFDRVPVYGTKIWIQGDRASLEEITREKGNSENCLGIFRLVKK